MCSKLYKHSAKHTQLWCVPPQAQPPPAAALSQAEREEVARRAATLAANIPHHVHLYGGLQPLDAPAPQPRWGWGWGWSWVRWGCCSGALCPASLSVRCTAGKSRQTRHK